MRRKIAVVLFFVLLLAATCMAQLNMLPRWALVFNVETPVAPATNPASRVAAAATEKQTSVAPAQSAAPTVPEPVAKSEIQPADSNVKPGLDIAKISRDGPSVFAGKASPNARVVVLDGDKEVATATANDNGDWSTVTDYKFANTNPDIKLKTLEPGAASVTDNGNAAAVPPASVPSPSVTTSPSVAMMKSFESVVATAREEAKSDHAPATLAAKPAAAPTVTPVPITFVFDEDVLTPDGQHSTELLLEYLKLKHFASVTLTGHADERGTADYNMELSRKRLEAILHRLRDGGYQGKLNLVPKGASEPFTGINRAEFAKEELMQLDRRVELRAAE